MAHNRCHKDAFFVVFVLEPRIVLPRCYERGNSLTQIMADDTVGYYFNPWMMQKQQEKESHALAIFLWQRV